MSARLPPPPQKPRHIAPAIHVLATRLAQNTAYRITIGNTPLHILHLCDARYLAPLFPKCSALTAITVHLRYVASATALEVFLQAAATSPSLRDVFLIGGVTAMEAAAISAGLAAFTFTQVTATSGAHVEAAPSVTVSLGPIGDRAPRPPLFLSHVAPPLAAELRGQPSFSAKKRRQKQATAAAPLASPNSASAAAALSPLQRSYGGRPLFFFRKSAPHTPPGFSQGGLHRRPSSSNASRVSSCPASPAVKGGVRVTLELHKVNEEISEVLLEGLRRGTRILCTTIHLCVGSADARLAGLRLTQQMKQATQVHRQQQQPWVIGATPRLTPPPRTPPNMSAAKSHNSSACGASWRQQRIAGALKPSPPYFPSQVQAAGCAPRLDAPPSPSFTRYAVRNPRAVEPVTAPHTPPFARAAGAPARAEEMPVAPSSDFFRLRGRNFLSSERGGASTPVDAVRQAWISAEPLRLRAVPPPALDAPHTPNPRPAFLTARQQPPRAAHRSHTAVSTLRRNNSSGSKTVSSSSFSPIVAGTLLGFCRGRSASFSSWSSRSTSPQPRRPAPPHSPAARAYTALAQRERRDPLHQSPPSLWTQQANCSLQPRIPLSPYVPVSPALCSPRYIVRRDGVDVDRMAAPCDGRLTQLSAPSQPQQNRTQRSTCSCFLCAPQSTSQQRLQQQVVPARHTQPSKTQPSHHFFPHTPTQPRRQVSEGVWGDDESAAHQRPVLPSPLASLSTPLSFLKASPPAVVHSDAAVAQTPRRRRTSHKDCQVLLEDGDQSTTAANGCNKSVGRETSEGTCSDGASTPGITARTPGEPNRNRRRVSADSSHRRVPSVEQHKSRRCVSHTRLPSSPEFSAPCWRSALTSPETPENSEGQSDSSENSGEGYVVYSNSLKFLRARVAEINRHVAWHQVKASKEAEEHAKHVAALGASFAGRVTTQLSDILMVLTDMEHGSRSGRAVRC